MSKIKRALVEAIRAGNELDFSLYLTKVGSADFQFDTHRQTPLHIAIQRNLLHTAEVLVEYGANVNRPNRSGITPLHVAVTHKSLDAIKFLLSHGADPNYKTKNNISPFDMAIRLQVAPILDILKEYGAKA